jgi:ferritin-like protein
MDMHQIKYREKLAEHLIKNLTKGWTNRYQYLVAEAFSGRRDLSWSPAGDEIAVFARRENARHQKMVEAGYKAALTRKRRAAARKAVITRNAA